MIDLAVPRDIEPQVADISDVYLFTVDDMRSVIAENLRLRESEASKADEIVEQGIKSIKSVLMERRSADVVRIYRESAFEIQLLELQKAQRMLKKGIAPEDVLSRFSRDLTNKLIHAPTAGLRHLAKEGSKSDVSKMAAALGLSNLEVDADKDATLQ